MLSPATFCAGVRKVRNSAQNRQTNRARRPSQKVYQLCAGPLRAVRAISPTPASPRGANQLGPSHLPRAHQAAEFRRRKASGFVRCRTFAVVYFLRKRSSRTTSPPPSGLSESASDLVSAGSGLAATGSGTLVCVVAL